MVNRKMEMWMKTVVNITINMCELYKIKEYNVVMVSIDFYIHNKQS